jgi:stage V sporulation protein S
MEAFKVSGKTKPSSLAGAVAKTLQEGKEVKVTAIGAMANNQCVKSLAVTNQFLASAGKRLDIIPAFDSLNSQEEITTLVYYLKLRNM